MVARFEAERQALAMMDHPNIAKVLDAGTTGASGQSSVDSDPSLGGGVPRTGQNAASRGAGKTIRLFKTTWENPRPDAVIESLDMISTHFRTCPFLVAVTAE